MICRRLFVVAVAAGAGCVENVPTLYATGTALVGIDLAPSDDHISSGLGHYRWELVEAPPDVNPVGPSAAAETAAIMITPPVRGIYVYDRWFVGQAAEQLSYHVVVTVDGAPPKALVGGMTMVAVGAPTSLDGTTSSSPEHRALTFEWRLALRPASSATLLVNATGATLTFLPDVAGDYAVELRVFDGELWSKPAMLTVTAR